MVAKDDGAERAAIHAAGRIEDGRAEGGAQRDDERAAGQVELVDDVVGVYVDTGAELQQHQANSGLAAGDVACQAEDVWHGSSPPGIMRRRLLTPDPSPCEERGERLISLPVPATPRRACRAGPWPARSRPRGW